MRRYCRIDTDLQPYAEGTIGIGFIDSINVQLVAPAAGLVVDNTDFYDQTAAFTLAGNAGLLWKASDRIGIFGQLGIRYVTGMSEVDDLVGTGLAPINDSSARWTMPFVAGVRIGF